jgi:hypothetical protein
MGIVSRYYISACQYVGVSLAVPCYRRANQIQDVRTNEQLLKLTDDDDGWIDTHHDMSEWVWSLCVTVV